MWALEWTTRLRALKAHTVITTEFAVSDEIVATLAANVAALAWAALVLSRWR